MVTIYSQVKQFEEKLYDKSKDYFNNQLTVFDEMMELFLEPLKEISEGWHFKKEKSPEIMLISRIFNDFETSRILILHGLTEQSHMPMRDIIECSMLFRLFGCNPGLALRWMKNLKEYSPKNIKAELKKLKVDCPEYDKFYGMLSELAHPNLLSVVHNVIERKTKDKWIIQTYMFGGLNNPSWTKLVLINILSMLLFVMTEILPSAYMPNMGNPEEWQSRVIKVANKIVELGAEVQFVEKEEVDNSVKKLVRKKMKLSQINFNLFDKQVVSNDKGFPNIDS